MMTENRSKFKKFSPQQNLTDYKRVGIVLCTRGTATIRVNDGLHTLQRGTIRVITPIIRGEMVEQSADYEELAFLDEVMVFQPVFQQLVDIVAKLNIAQHPILELEEEEVASYWELHRTLLVQRQQLVASKNSLERKLHALSVENALQGVLLKTLAHFAHALLPMLPQEEEEKPALQVMPKFMVLLNLHYNRERSVQFYAQELGFSTGHFTALVKAQSGRPPSEWIAQIMMERARSLLLQTRLSIKEVAEELGFPEQFSFRKYFKLHEGLSPKAYRKSQTSDAPQ